MSRADALLEAQCDCDGGRFVGGGDVAHRDQKRKPEAGARGMKPIMHTIYAPQGYIIIA